MHNLRFFLLLLITVLISISESLGQLSTYDPNYTYTSFEENFSGTSINETVWKVSTAYKRDLGLLIDSSATISVADGKLKLSMIDCPNCQVTSWNGTVYSGNFAGAEVYTREPFHFQYGIFECRAKFAQQSGAWPAFWLIGGDGTPCPPGGYANEIDIAEYFCKGALNKMEHNIHHYHPPADCNNSELHKVDEEVYYYDVNYSYHIFKCIWTPDKIEYFIDGQLKHSVTNNNQTCSSTGEEWFPVFPQRIALSQQVTSPGDYPGVVTPQTSYFDWVKVKTFFEPIIECNYDICPTETATLNGVEEATNVSWNLTPTSLFSGNASGTGKTATINRANGAVGKGLITFNFDMPDGSSFSIDKEIWVGPRAATGFQAFDLIDNVYVNEPLQTGRTYEIRPLLSYPSNNDLDYDWEIEDESGQLYLVPPGPTATFMAFSEGEYTFRLKYNNGCGWSATKYKDFTFENSSSIMITMSPNPTSGETTLTLLNTTEEENQTTTTNAFSDASAFDNDEEWELEIYDHLQNLKAKKTKIKGNKIKIKTQDWRDGVYFIRVKYKEELIQGKLVVKNE